MLERFGREARRAVSLAGEEAQALRHGHIGTEHLLLGILAESGTAASDALVASGASLVPARAKVMEALASRTGDSTTGPRGDLPFTDRATRTLDRAGRLSLRMGSEYVKCEHILLSVLDVEGTAGQVLRGLGVDPEAVKRALSSMSSALVPPDDAPVEEADREDPQTAEGVQPGVPEPVCGACRTSIATSLNRTSLSVGAGPSATQVDVYYCSACGTTIAIVPR